MKLSRYHKGSFVSLLCGLVLILSFQNCGYVDPSKSHMLNLPSTEGGFSSLNDDVIGPKCLTCHTGATASGGYDLSTYAGIMDGGRVVPGQPDASLLYNRVNSGSMPPGAPLSNAEKNSIKNWILSGAPPTGGGPAPTPTPAPQNMAPVANAGPDQNLVLPASNAPVFGSATDTDGTIASVAWTKVSGPNVTLNGANTTTVNLDGLQVGTYVLRLTATDNEGLSHSDTVQINVTAAPNVAPTVSAGADQTVTLPVAQLILAGTATDSDGTIATRTWTKTSGPNVTMANANTLNLTLTNLAAGTYVFQLAVTDNSGASANDSVQIIVNAAANVLPTANAGADRTITAPTSTVSITGAGTDSDGTIASVRWTQVSGPSTATLGTATTNTLQASALVVGTYVFRYTVTDNRGGTAMDDVSVIVNAANNVAPTVSAGADRSLNLPTSSISITGTASDSDGSIASTQWTQVSGPNTATIGSANALMATISNVIAGSYTFQLRATDNSGSSSVDSMVLTVVAAPNTLPTANAGADRSITLPTSSVTISGSGTDSDGTIVSYAWRQVSGPNTATLSGGATATLTASGLAQGSYNFELRVTDNLGGSAVDTMVVTVAAAANVAPTSNAGADQSITLPTSSITINGSGTDSDGTISAYAWTQVSGPSSATLSGASTASLTASALIQGSYAFQLRVTDNGGATANDTVTVTVAGASNPNATFAWLTTNVFTPRCLSCHGSGGEAGLDVRSHASVLRKLVPGNATNSELYRQVNSGNMPESGSKLPAASIQNIRDWIDAGALNN